MLSSTVDTGGLCAESRAAHHKSMDSDADETGVIQFGQCVFFGQVRHAMDKVIRGF